MDKNCSIIIKSGSNLVRYTLDDYRIATAICNILDNVAELDTDDLNRPQLKYINKEASSIFDDPYYMAQKCKQNASYGSLVQELFKGDEQNGASSNYM